jgi:hypothetical protein
MTWEEEENTKGNSVGMKSGCRGSEHRNILESLSSGTSRSIFSLGGKAPKAWSADSPMSWKLRMRLICFRCVFYFAVRTAAALKKKGTPSMNPEDDFRRLISLCSAYWFELLAKPRANLQNLGR